MKIYIFFIFGCCIFIGPGSILGQLHPISTVGDAVAVSQSAVVAFRQRCNYRFRTGFGHLAHATTNT